MKSNRLVNEKVLVTFLCSMISLLALSSILSHIDTKKDTKTVSASVNDVKKVSKVEVDNMNVYSKNEALTEKIEEVVEEVKEPEVKEEVKVEEPVQKVEQPVVTAPPVQVASDPVPGTVEEYQAYAHSQFARYGWSDEDFNCLVELWNRESGWNPASHNSRSGAHGIPQALPASKMAPYGEDYMTNYIPQINWGLDYISGRYGNPTAALNSLRTKGWY